jgi:hypothetical protein
MTQLLRKWIQDGAVNSAKLDSTDSYTMANLTVSGDATVQGNFLAVGMSFTNLNITGDSTVGGGLSVANGVKTPSLFMDTTTVSFFIAPCIKDATYDLIDNILPTAPYTRASIDAFIQVNGVLHYISGGLFFDSYSALMHTKSRINFTADNALTYIDALNDSSAFSATDTGVNSNKFCLFTTAVAQGATPARLRLFNRFNISGGGGPITDSTVWGQITYRVMQVIK